MISFRMNSVRGFVFLLGAGIAAAASPLDARADAGFKTWITKFYPVAAQSGITRSTYEKAFSGVSEPDQDVLEKAAYQPEFKSKIWDYLDSRVNPLSLIHI